MRIWKPLHHTDQRLATSDSPASDEEGLQGESLTGEKHPQGHQHEIVPLLTLLQTLRHHDKTGMHLPDMQF
jgi:hypothetical protein